MAKAARDHPNAKLLMRALNFSAGASMISAQASRPKELDQIGPPKEPSQTNAPLVLT